MGVQCFSNSNLWLWHVQDKTVSVFETTIRILGGLLSAHLIASDYATVTATIRWILTWFSPSILTLFPLTELKWCSVLWCFVANKVDIALSAAFSFCFLKICTSKVWSSLKDDSLRPCLHIDINYALGNDNIKLLYYWPSKFIAIF